MSDKKVIKIGKEKTIKKDGNNEINNQDYIVQLDWIRKIYMNEEFIEKEKILQVLNKKISGYRYQDIIKKRDIENIININDCVEKILSQKLLCYYCKKKLLIFYPYKRQDNQWTLDRIDNMIPHSNENTCVSCLKCNLQKRRRDHDKFKYTKQLVLIKDDN